MQWLSSCSRCVLHSSSNLLRPFSGHASSFGIVLCGRTLFVVVVIVACLRHSHDIAWGHSSRLYSWPGRFHCSFSLPLRMLLYSEGLWPFSRYIRRCSALSALADDITTGHYRYLDGLCRKKRNKWEKRKFIGVTDVDWLTFSQFRSKCLTLFGRVQVSSIILFCFFCASRQLGF